MITPYATHPLTFIQKAMSQGRTKRNITVQDIKTILEEQLLLTTLHHRGLFIVLLSELIYYHSTLFVRQLKLLYNQVCPPIKAIRKKRENQEGHPPKRKIKTRVNVEDVSIEKIAGQSITNPSNIQAGRMEDNKEQSKGSKPSNESQPALDIDFHADLGEMADNDKNINFYPQIHHESEENSSGSQSTQSSNLIPNLAEKLRVLGGDASISKRTVPKRRRGQAGVTVRRKEPNIVDISIVLEETKQTIDLRDIPRAVIKEKCRALDLIREQEQTNKFLSSITQKITDKLFAPETLRRLKDFEKSKKKIDSSNEPNFDFETGNTMFEHEFTVPSTHFSATQEEINFNKSIQQKIDFNFFEGETTLTDLKVKTHKPKEEIFFNVLWMASRGQVTLRQENPEKFGEINVKWIG